MSRTPRFSFLRDRTMARYKRRLGAWAYQEFLGAGIVECDRPVTDTELRVIANAVAQVKERFKP